MQHARYACPSAALGHNRDPRSVRFGKDEPCPRFIGRAVVEVNHMPVTVRICDGPTDHHDAPINGNAVLGVRQHHDIPRTQIFD